MPNLTDPSIKTVTTISDDDLIHNVDVSDPTGSAEGTSAKIRFGDIKTTLGQPLNVVLVIQESDFGVNIAGQITLANNTKYVIGISQLITSAELILPLNGNVQISGQGLHVTTWIFVGSGKTLFTGTNIQNGSLYLTEMTLIDGVGNNTLYNCTGHPTLSFIAEVYSTLCIIYGWFSRGTLKDLTLINFNESEHYNNGELIIDNIFALSLNNYVSFNFFPNSQGLHFTIKTNINQANVSACAFGSAKNESIFYIDPAINAESGISIGTAVPYQGVVSALVSKIEDIGGGKVKITCPNGISFDNGDIILLRFTANYNGAFAVSNVVKFNPSITAGTFEITAAFAGDDAQGQAILLDGASPKIENFFQIRTSGSITNIADNGGGFTRITSAGHGLSTGESLKVFNTIDYDQGGFAVVIDANNYDLLDTFGQPVPFVSPESSGDWTTSSLDQKDNVITTLGAGGILPDSQSVGNNILISTIAFASTTTLTRIATGSWFSDEAQRFKPTADGRLIYTGKTAITVTLSAKVIAARQSGTAASAFVNFMIDIGGTGTFIEVPNHPSTEGEILSSRANTFALTGIIEDIAPGDVLAVGFASDANFTVDISAIDFNVKK